MKIYLKLYKFLLFCAYFKIYFLKSRKFYHFLTFLMTKILDNTKILNMLGKS